MTGNGTSFSDTRSKEVHDARPLRWKNLGSDACPRCSGRKWKRTIIHKKQPVTLCCANVKCRLKITLKKFNAMKASARSQY